MIVKAKWTDSELLRVQLGAKMAQFYSNKTQFCSMNEFFLTPDEAYRFMKLLYKRLKKLKKK